MKRVISVVLALAISVSMLSACGNQSEKDGSEIIQSSDVKEKSEKESSGLHTLYFKDSTKSDRAVATFFNSVSEESTDVEMKKISEDSKSVTFSCEGDCAAYNMAYVTCGDKKSREFAFNKCVSGWYGIDDYVLPYTEGKEPCYSHELEEVTLTGYGSETLLYIWTPDDYDPMSDEKYSTIYALDGQSLLFSEDNGQKLKDCPGFIEQVEAMSSVTGEKAIVVGIESAAARNYELVPQIGISRDEEDFISKHDSAFADEFDCMNGTQFADFAAHTVVPYIQQHYNVYSDALHTSVEGYSLGGLEAFYIAVEYPEVFGTSGSMSPSFWEFDDSTWKSYLSKKSFGENSPSIYLYTGPDPYDTGPEVTDMYNRLKDMGYPESKLTLHFNKTGTHSSVLWRSFYSEFFSIFLSRVERSERI